MAHADLLSHESATHTDPQPFVIAGREFHSRLMVGTGKYESNARMLEAIEASGAEVVTVAVRRVDLDRRAGSLREACTRGRLQRVGQARGDRRQGDAPAGYRRTAGRDEDTG